MSGSAYRLAIRDRLRTQLGLTTGECDLTRGPEPHPSAGHTFIAIHQGSWSTRQPSDNYLDEVIGVHVTISLKAGRYPGDRWGTTLAGNSSDADLPPFELIARRIIAQIHLNHTLRGEANDNIANDSAGFIEPLRFLRAAGPPRNQMPEWWSATPPARRGQRPTAVTPAGMSQTLIFDGARRIQAQAELDPT